MKQFFIIILFSLSVFTTHAQFMDSIKASLKHKPKLDFRFYNRYSFVSNKFAKILAFRVGLDFNKTFRTGLGFHRLQSSLITDKYIYNTDSIISTIDTVSQFLRMYYISAYAEYVVYSSDKWEFAVPIQLGVGRSGYEFYYQNKFYQENNSLVLLYEANIEGHYKIIPYVGIGAGVGYRLMLINNKTLLDKFNAPIFVIKIKIFLGDIYRATIKKKYNE